jgi:flagellar basal-body rod protein FlgB
MFAQPAFRLLEKGLDAAALRQRVIANNVANVDTPMFKRSDVSFEDLLNQQLGAQAPLQGLRTDPRHIPIGPQNQFPSPVIVTDTQSVMNNNLNNVDIDYEMASMAANQLRYNVMVQEISSELKRVQTALDGRA